MLPRFPELLARVKVVLHWSTCNANLQRRFATHVFCTNLQTCYTFESLSKTSNALQHCKYRTKSFATGRYTRIIFRATSYHCELALQVDQCNITFRAEGATGTSTRWRREPQFPPSTLMRASGALGTRVRACLSAFLFWHCPGPSFDVYQNSAAVKHQSRTE